MNTLFHLVTIARVTITRNTLDCDQSNYSSRIVFFYISIEFGETGNNAIRFVDPENPTP